MKHRVFFFFLTAGRRETQFTSVWEKLNVAPELPQDVPARRVIKKFYVFQKKKKARKQTPAWINNGNG